MRFIPIFLIVISFSSFSQVRPENGMKEHQPKLIAYTNATIMVSPTKVIKNGTLLVEDDKIKAVGSLIFTPKEALVIDCEQQFIIPSFIEINAHLIANNPHKTNKRGPQLETSKQGPYYWNEAIHPEIDGLDQYIPNEGDEKKYVDMGFGWALSHLEDGIARGTGPLIALGNIPTERKVIDGFAANFYSFDKGSSKQSYPSSQMGSIALLRQFFYDLAYYQTNKNQPFSATFHHSINHLKKSNFFFSRDKYDVQRISKISNEFKIPFIIIGTGNEYQAMNDFKKDQTALVIPINFPKNYALNDPYLMDQIALRDLKHWELAPSNPYFLSTKRIPFSITSEGITNAKDFWKNIRLIMERGLSQEQVLNALTLQAAKFLKKDSLMGTLEEGKLASFHVYDGNPFLGDARVIGISSLGKWEQKSMVNTESYLGVYDVQLKQQKYQLEILGTNDKPNGKIYLKNTPDSAKVNVQIQVKEKDITFQFAMKDENLNGLISLHAKMNMKFGALEGDGKDGQGNWFTWSGVKKEKNHEGTNITAIKLDSAYSDKIWFPNMAYGSLSRKQAENVIIKNATVWTNENEGVLKDATVIVKNGKISFVGTSNFVIPNDAKVIDAKGKHLTSGIIDEHSHIALTNGVNEGGQAISAEVNIGDVLYSDDINIYRQLAGGVTSSQLLHGSANPIGGQSALIKLKWGVSPDALLIPNAPKFIKFALGENVKQSNWGDYDRVRFPQTRMGVEQIYMDAFSRAKAYEEKQKQAKLGKGIAPPRDLELDILVEILNHQRNITCHSYVQSEINMLMHVADTFGIKINTFTHILEGYKLADKMQKHGAAGSTFADWWAYKYEVNDAIPYNAKIMHDQGVLVSINSDDAEMGRRLNQEAAKTVKYGGMSEVEAWKLVTLNPAKMLHLDDRMGSIKAGKDADLVLWDQNPLSVYAKVQFTLVDGVVEYDIHQDQILQKQISLEKARIIEKMMHSNQKGAETTNYKPKRKRHFHCDTIGEEGSLDANTH